MEKQEMIVKVMNFRVYFEKAWKVCLEKIAFNEINAFQFKLGNRLRPTLFFMGASFNNRKIDYKKIAKLSCSLELIHKASVMFDDYIDEDELRNGQDAFHEQYQSINKMILLGSTMLGQAGINWSEDVSCFCCDSTLALEGSKRLFEIIKRLCTGCYKELSLPQYGKQSVEEINRITYDETVFLIQTSLVLGYLAGHDVMNSRQKSDMESLGENFGYIFQWLNDIEPYSKSDLYIQHKGAKEIHFDYGRKNIALLELYRVSTKEEQRKIDSGEISYGKVIELYREYDIEKYVLEKVNRKCGEIRSILEELYREDSEWVIAFQWLFDEALEKKDWAGQVEDIHFRM